MRTFSLVNWRWTTSNHISHDVDTSNTHTLFDLKAITRSLRCQFPFITKVEVDVTLVLQKFSTGKGILDVKDDPLYHEFEVNFDITIDGRNINQQNMIYKWQDSLIEAFPNYLFDFNIWYGGN